MIGGGLCEREGEHFIKAVPPSPVSSLSRKDWKGITVQKEVHLLSCWSELKGLEDLQADIRLCKKWVSQTFSLHLKFKEPLGA